MDGYNSAARLCQTGRLDRPAGAAIECGLDEDTFGVDAAGRQRRETGGFLRHDGTDAEAGGKDDRDGGKASAH
ncbi:hypothetical protein D3C71_1816170 [compost metagenome]